MKYWEPWTPEIGQRVCIRVSGESPGGALAAGLDGEVMTVVGCDRESLQGRQGYPYLLDRTERFWWWSACELEPLEDA